MSLKICKILIMIQQNEKTAEEILTPLRGKGNFSNCVDYEDALKAIKEYAALPQYDYHDGGKVNVHPQFIDGYNVGYAKASDAPEFLFWVWNNNYYTNHHNIADVKWYDNSGKGYTHFELYEKFKTEK
jgi:hypothetical protein